MKQKNRDKRALYTNTAGGVHSTAVAKMYVTSYIGLQVGISNAENCCKIKGGMLHDAVRISVLDCLGLRSFEMSFLTFNTAYISKK